MNELTPVVTSVTRSGNRLTFHRVWLEEAGGTPPDQITVPLDPDAAPLFGRHPQGGWVSPPYEQLAELRSLGLEPDEVTHVICRCQKTITSHDVDSLESTGHAASCPKAPRPPQPVRLPVQANPVAEGVPADAYAYVKDPAARALLSRDGADAGPPPKPASPKGGLTDEQLSSLMAALEGEGQECQLTDGLEQAHITGVPVDLKVVAHQLFAQESFSRCASCKTWAHVGPDRTCGRC